MNAITKLNFELDDKVQIVENLSYHSVANKHLWIAVDKGSVIVLNTRLNFIFNQLIQGMAPKEIILNAEDKDNCLVNLQLLLKKCAEAGFLNECKGYVIKHSGRDARKFARLHITRRCQLKCIHCYMNAGMQYKEEDELTTFEWKNIITDLANNGCTSIVFTGGEPLLRKDCIELLKHARGSKINTIGVMTNGLLVTRYIEDLSKYVDVVQIGLDGADEETNDKIRGKGTFKKIIEAIDALSKTKINVRISMAFMEINWKSLMNGAYGLAEKYDKNQIKFVIGNGLLDYGRGTKVKEDFDKFQFKEFVTTFNASFYPPIEAAVHHRLPNCGIFTQILISHDGYVYPCHLQHCPMGHIKDKTIKEWQDIYEQQWRKHTVKHVDGCKDCDLRNICGGTCRILDQIRTGSECITTCTPRVKENTYLNLVRLYS